MQAQKNKKLPATKSDACHTTDTAGFLDGPATRRIWVQLVWYTKNLTSCSTDEPWTSGCSLPFQHKSIMQHSRSNSGKRTDCRWRTSTSSESSTTHILDAAKDCFSFFPHHTIKQFLWRRVFSINKRSDEWYQTTMHVQVESQVSGGPLR
jgi:hypothetical protein